MDKYYLEEIRLSRELARSIEQYRNIIPLSIWQPYLKLKEHYLKEIEANIQ
jgi:hypothetical protein